jgi:hypothetical protein
MSLQPLEYRWNNKMSRKTIGTFGAAALLLMAIPSAMMSLPLVGMPGMVLLMMMTDVACWPCGT